MHSKLNLFGQVYRDYKGLSSIFLKILDANAVVLGTCQKLTGGEGGWEFKIWVRKLGDPSLQWE